MLTVVLGAFGAHSLNDTLLENGKLSVYETAVRYQSMHALVLLIVGIIQRWIQSKWLHRSVLFFVIGVIIFSGSLYILSITNIGFLGAITPLGGLLLILGWVFLIIGFRSYKDN